MLKMELQDFVEEIKAEMAGYEEISEEDIKVWDERFKIWISNEKTKNNRIKRKANSIIIELKDEADLFSIVDRYFAAIVNDEMDKYWNNWQL